MYMGSAILICSASAKKVSLISVLYFLNGAQSVNATFVLLLDPSTVIFPVTKTYTSE